MSNKAAQAPAPATSTEQKASRSAKTFPARAVCTAGLALALGVTGGLAPFSTAWADEQQAEQPGEATDNGTAGEGQPGGGSAPADAGSAGGTTGDAPDAGGGGANTQSFDYSGSYSATVTADGSEETVEGEAIDATEASLNAVLAQNGGTLTVKGGVITKTGDVSDGDSCNFYGVNSIALAVGEESTARISNTSLTATSEGSNGLFATDGATIWARDCTIDTSADNSRGLDATYGGTVIADNMVITTAGDHCAGAATDRGGGYVSVANSTITTAGSGSPILYSTGAVEADNIVGTANGSQLVGMEGLNTIRIANSTLESDITQATASDPVANGIIIYQSTSGDAETSTGERALFEARDSSLSSSIASGSMFYLTNTSADIVLSNTDLSFDTDAANLITVEGNDANNWGSAGSNGADVTLTAREQELEGTISVDTISSLDVYLLDDSTFTGATQITENEAGSTSDEPISMTLESGSSWVVTDDSTASNLAVEDGAEIVDENGDTVGIVCDDETVVEGTSDLTITVEGTYATEIDTSGALELTDGSIDRTDFDSYYDTSTAFGSNGDAEAVTDDDSADVSASDAASDTDTDDDEDSGIVAWFKDLWDRLVSLFV